MEMKFYVQCNECGWTGRIKELTVVEVSGKHIQVCPNCGNEDMEGLGWSDN
jgi:predicted RNA-binding Zn-ribbon protein involved in translation (DUF1610 family)